MIQDIIKGIAAKLDAKYGKPVSSELRKQDLVAPCFYVKLITSREEQIIGERYSMSLPFDVHYFPGGDIDQEMEIYGILLELYETLEYVSMGTDLVKGTSMHHEVHEGVLHFFVDYNLILLKQTPPTDLMEDVHIDSV